MTTPDPNHDNPTATENRFSGLYPDNTYPLVAGNIDDEQEQRKQARQEGVRTRRVFSDVARDAHPELTEKYTTNDHAARAAVAAPTTMRVLRTTTREALSVSNTFIPVVTTTGIVAGDVVTLSRGLPAQESVTVTIVDTDAGGARFQIGAGGLTKNHATGANVHEFDDGIA